LPEEVTPENEPDEKDATTEVGKEASCPFMEASAGTAAN
jgi:hypothetical protein